MAMAVQRCSRRAVHDVHIVQAWVAATSSGHHHHDSLHGSLDASLHGHGPVGALAALSSIKCLLSWPSYGRPAVVWKEEDNEQCARTSRGVIRLKRIYNF
jgi:hypothetical protein